LRYPRVARNGIEIEFIADVYSDNGEIIARRLLDDFYEMHDMWKDAGNKSPSWSVRSVIDASDNYDAIRFGSYIPRS